MPMNRARRQLLSQRAENMRKQMTPAEKALWFRFLREYWGNHQRYDQIRTLYLETIEIKELRFTNTDVYESFEGVCEAIHTEVEKRRNDLFDQKEAFASLTRKR